MGGCQGSRRKPRPPDRRSRKMKPIRLYDFNASAACRAVKMTAKLLKIPLEVVSVNYLGGEHLGDKYREINPFHTLPAIDDDGFILFESRAIMVYLVNKYAPDTPLYPKDPRERAEVDQMLHLDNGTVYRVCGDLLAPQLEDNVSLPEETYRHLKEILHNFDELLSRRRYVAGETMTLADISFSTTISMLDMSFFDISLYVNITDYLTRMRDRLSPLFEEICDDPVAGYRNFVKHRLAQG